MPRRAVLSVANKTEIEYLAEELGKLDFLLYSTGGTKDRLDSGCSFEINPISVITGVDESGGGKVKTIHHKIAAGLLHGEGDPQYTEWNDSEGVETIHVVANNLYPFEDTMFKFLDAGGDIHSDEADEIALEFCDIGGTLLHGAGAKSPHAAILSRPSQYERAIKELQQDGKFSKEFQTHLSRIAHLEMGINRLMLSEFYRMRDTTAERFDETVVQIFSRFRQFRYGENSHQDACGYKKRSFLPPRGVINAQVLKEGKELSRNNILDLDAAVKAAGVMYLLDGAENGVVTVKHGNPCGFATGASLEKAIEQSYLGDPLSAFGGILAIKGKVTKKDAEKIQELYYKDGAFIEAIVAESYTTAALKVLHKKKNIRTLQLDSFKDSNPDELQIVNVDGGAMLETKDNKLYEKLEVVAGRFATRQKRGLLEAGIASVMPYWSNAVSIVHEYEPGQYAVVGAGIGNANRVLSTKEACEMAHNHFRDEYIRDNDTKTGSADYAMKKMRECVMTSEAFFPDKDNVEVAQKWNIKTIIQPGGSNADKDVNKYCKDNKITMIHTGTRHFNHGGKAPL